MTEAGLPNWHGYCHVRFETEFYMEPGLEKLAICIDPSEKAKVGHMPDCTNCPIAQKRVQRLYEMGFAPGCPAPYGLPPGSRDPGYKMIAWDGLENRYVRKLRREGEDRSSYVIGVGLGYLFIKDVRKRNGTN